MSDALGDRLRRAVEARRHANEARRHADEEVQAAATELISNCVTSALSSEGGLLDVQGCAQLVQQIVQKIHPLFQVHCFDHFWYKPSCSRFTLSYSFTGISGR